MGPAFSQDEEIISASQQQHSQSTREISRADVLPAALSHRRRRDAARLPRLAVGGGSSGGAGCEVGGDMCLHGGSSDDFSHF